MNLLLMRARPALSGCTKDGNPRFIHKILLTLIGLAKQVAFDSERASLRRLRALLFEMNTADRLFSRAKLGLRTGPAIGSVASLHLRTE